MKLHFGLPWTKARAWLDTGKVFVNGNCRTAHDHKVSQGDRIELRMGTPKRGPRPDLAPETIIFFDKQIVIANKPAGVMTVPHPQSDETDTFDREVLGYLRHQDPDTELNKASLGVVHRIDKETSGLLVFTRTFRAKQHLSDQFRQHTIERKYLAIVHGDMKEQTIRNRLLRDTGDGIRGAAPKDKANQAGEELGRRAVTHVEVVERLSGATLVACRIETGRTHQIRIHLSEAGHPIIGEKVYIRAYKEPIIPANRVMLHAAELGFIHPRSGESVHWEQGLPQDFKIRLRKLRHAPNRESAAR